MTTCKLILFRLAVRLLCWHPAGSAFLRRLLLKMVKKDGKISYVAHADFLDVRELQEGAPRALIPCMREKDDHE